ncbi:MAG: hypothetical protein WD042_08010 [Phycisphaeraceae bacterium]
MIAATAQRVASNTAEHINEQIRHQTEENVAACASAGPKAIEQRLEELDHEWDIERCVETLAPSLTLLGLGLGLTVSRKWFIVPAVVQAFFLQHAVQGWCPPVPILRRLGVRTAHEIDQERNALKSLRGDYRHIPKRRDGDAARRALDAAER